MRDPTHEEIRALMESSRSPMEWDRNAHSLRDDTGAYPDDWDAVVVESGLCDRVRARWGDTGPRLKIVALDCEAEGAE